MVYDKTGGGSSFGDFLVTALKDSAVHGVNSAEAPSDTPVGVDGKKASELFADKVSELWIVGKYFLQGGQIRGLTKGVIRDMVARREDPKKYGGGVKRAVESKRAMKRRIHRSPDKGDTFFLLLDLCRTVLKFRAVTSRATNQIARQKWQTSGTRFEEVSNTAVPTNVQDIGAPPPRKRNTSWQPEEDVESSYVDAFYGNG